MNALLLSALLFAHASPGLGDFDLSHQALRDKFLAEARGASGAITSDPVAGDFIDSVYLPGEGRGVVILISGIHGVELPAGDFIQRHVLASCRPRKAGLLIVHGMNPWGAKNGRRVNEQNVDLNRNCFDQRKPGFPGATIRNPDYEHYRVLLENPLSSFELALHGVFERAAIRRSLSGQYESPTGIYYGGATVQPECRIVQERMSAVVDRAENVLLLDLHTGLGDRGIAQIMLDGDVTAREKKLVNETLFPRLECRGVCEVQEASSYDFATHGDLTQWIYDAYPGKRERDLVVSATLEIGTEGALSVLPGLVNENVCHRDGCVDQARHASELRRLFTPTDKPWRAQVVRAAQQVCRAIERFDRL